MNEISTKIQKLDLSFILDHFLSERLWEKKWDIFVYNGVQVSASITSINVRRKTVEMEIKTNMRGFCEKMGYNLWGYDDTDSISLPYEIAHRNIQLFENQIFRAMIRSIEWIEQRVIKTTDTYHEAEAHHRKFKDKLIEIAEKFLDEQGVKHKEIREAYITKYLNEAEIPDFTYDVISLYKHTKVSKLLVMASLFFDNKEGKEKYSKYIQLNGFKVGAIRKELAELREKIEDDEFIEEMKVNLTPIIEG